MPSFQKDSFLKLIEGDRQLANELVDLFQEDWRPIVERIHKAISQGQAGDVEKLAHRLKGNLKNFFAEGAATKAKKLEEAGRGQSLEGAQDLLDDLVKDVEVLENELNEFLEEL